MDYDVNELIKKLEEKGVTNTPCQMCGNANWIVENSGFAGIPRQTSNRNMSLDGGGVGFNLAVSSCKNCGNTVFYNLNILGLMD